MEDEKIENGLEQDLNTSLDNQNDDTNIYLEDEYNTEDENDIKNNDENKPFSVDDLDFSDTYKVGDYDLSKYKNIIDEGYLSELDEYAKKYAEKGFSQEQIEFLIDETIEENKPRNKEDVIKELNKSLSIEEKRNYKTVGAHLKQVLEENNLGKYYEEAMANPVVYKIINSLVKNQKGANIGAKTEVETRATKKMDGYTAVNEFNKYLQGGDTSKKEEKIKELYGKLATEEDKKYFKELLSIN